MTQIDTDEVTKLLLLTLDDMVINAETLLEVALIGRTIDMMIENLQVVRTTVHSRLSDMMDGRATVAVDGVGMLERTRSSSWKPISAATEVTLVGRLASIMRGVTRSPSTAAYNAAAAVRDHASLSWRVTKLRETGIDVPMFLDVTHGDWKVKIPKA